MGRTQLSADTAAPEQSEVTVVISDFNGKVRFDVAGAFGDIGILFPIVIALITLNHMNATAVFLAAGAAYIFAGCYFRIPIAVQPFKAVAAIALALGLSPQQVASAGLLIGILLAFIALTNLADVLARIFTVPIIRGIQLGLGIMLVREGLKLIRADASAIAALGISLSSWHVATIAGVILVLLAKSQRVPAALALVLLGILLGIGRTFGGLSHDLQWRPIALDVLHLDRAQLWQVLPLLVIPQFALTFGNSIVASENTAKLLFGERARRVTIRGLTASIAIMNIAGAMILASPMCHGSGGITAHHKFGARTMRSNLVIGVVCLVLAMVGTAAVSLLKLIPTAVLGVFLIYVGTQHALYLRDIRKRVVPLVIAVSVGIVWVITGNAMWGFVIGLSAQAFSSWLQHRNGATSCWALDRGV
jgi:sulfate permease, SulP family